jgi:UDP-N-acetylglucosamine 2-epimerase (non-hydrolysing)
MRKRVLTIFGTRPEAIKLAPVIKKLEATKGIETVVCVTAQHREMLDQVLRVFEITPDHDLDIMTGKQDLYDITIKSLAGLRGVIEHARPDLVLVQGDTTTAFVGGLAAFYARVPVGHIEAGLRTENKYSPFPEEINRRIVSVVADYHFAPTEHAKRNLLKENVPQERIWVTGNTVVDALMHVVEKQRSKDAAERWRVFFRERWNVSIPGNDPKNKLILVTGHRRENFGAKFEQICSALKLLAETRRDAMIVYPVHLNPNVRKPVQAILNTTPNIHLIEPLEYEPFAFLMSNAYLILTDSGGIQEEAPSLGKPVLVMRDTTERPEAIEAGTVRLVGTDRDTIVSESLRLMDDPALYRKMSTGVNPYGDGKAAERIVSIVLDLDLAPTK